MSIASFIADLRQRRVFRALAWYGAVAWLIIQAVTLVREPFGLGPTIVRSAIALLLAGIPVVALLSWAFDLTPQGLVRTGEVPAARSGSPWFAPSPWLAFAAGVLLVFGAYTAWQPRIARSEADRVRITVLPFANLTGRADDQALVDGLHDAVIGELGGNPNLEVTTRFTTNYLAATMVDPQRIAEELRTQYLMEGSVRRDADRLDLDLRLTHRDSGRVVWRQDYRRPLADALVVQRELAAAVAGVLWVAATPPEYLSSARPADPQAVEIYLRARARYFVDLELAPEELEAITAMLDDAVELDPAFAPGWAFLARLHARQSMSLGVGGAYKEHMPRARAAATRASELDPNLVDAAAAWTYVAQHEGDYRGWLAAALRAKALNTGHPDADHRLAHALENLQRWDEAIAIMQALSRREPHQAEWWVDLGDFMRARGRWDEAQAAYEHLGPLDEGLAQERSRALRFCATGDSLEGQTRAEAIATPGDPWGALSIGEYGKALEWAKARYESRIKAGADPGKMLVLSSAYATALYLNGQAEGARKVAQPVLDRLASTALDDVQPTRRPYYYMGRAQFLHLAGAPEAEVRATLDQALGLFAADDHSNLAEHTRRLVAQTYAFALHDGAKAVELLSASLRYSVNDDINGCPWSNWRTHMVEPIKDYAPFRELMTQYGVDVDKGIDDYGQPVTPVAATP